MITTKYLLENTTQIKIGYGTRGKKGTKLNIIASITNPENVYEMLEAIGFDDNNFHETLFYVHPFMYIHFCNGSDIVLRLNYLDDGCLRKADWDYTKTFQPKHFSKFLTLLKNLMPTDLKSVDIRFLNYWENMDKRIEQIKTTEKKIITAKTAYVEGLSLEMIAQLTGFTAEQITEILNNHLGISQCKLKKSSTLSNLVVRWAI